MPKVETFKQACDMLSIPVALPEVANLPERFQRKVLADYQLDVMIEAENESHVFDYNDFDERKYFPVFDMETYGDNPAGSGFVLGAVAGEYDAANVGSRRVFKTEESCRAFVEMHIHLYRDSIR